MKAVSRTHIGNVRKSNQDALLVQPGEFGLYGVADGMGGHKAGDVASRMAVETLKEALSSARPNEESLRKAIEKEFGYDLAFTCDGIRGSYGWGSTCQDTVPQAIVAFLDGTDFEDCIRNAISIGGDSDTLGCITGSIAEAFFGIPKEIYDKGLEFLTPHFKNVVREFEGKYGNKVI